MILRKLPVSFFSGGTIKCFLHCISTDNSIRCFEVTVYHLFLA
ncbi:hypothetical protein OIU78_013846 [Salix suchowensis]|nr:hypothetical protein OIU78_013846 [Salix suchowensis]